MVSCDRGDCDVEQSTERLGSMDMDIIQIIYTWPDGREEVRYERPIDSEDARRVMTEVDEAQARCELLGETCAYSYRLPPMPPFQRSVMETVSP